MDQVETTRGTDLEALLRTLWRRRGLIALCLILATASTLGFSLSQRKEYSASASLLFRDPGFDQKLFGSNFLPPSTDPTREAATNSQLVSLETVAARASKALHGRLSAGAVSSKISVNSQGQSNVVSITATDRSPRFAAKLANAVAEQYTFFRRNADQAKIRQAQELVTKQINAMPPKQRSGAEGRSLQDRDGQLSILASLQTGNAELVQPAQVPSSPSSPKTLRNTLLGAAFGLFLGVALALLLERLDRRVRTPDELAHAYGLPILAAIPEDRDLAQQIIDERSSSGSPAREAFRMLRARLRYFNVDRRLSSILITSPAPGDGKSTVSWNLAHIAAVTRGARILLIEADLRRPDMARQHNLTPSPGLAELLTRDIRLEDVAQNVAIPNQSDDERLASRLDVLVAGATPPNPAELIESRAMSELLQETSVQYDLIVVDTPPLSIVSDTIPLMSKVDGVVVVSGVDKTTRHAAAHMRDQLRALNAPVLGIVANRITRQAGDYYAYAQAYTARESVEIVPPNERELAKSSDGNR